MDNNEAKPLHAHPPSHNFTRQRSPASKGQREASQPSTYAFLNHSAATVNSNLPPNVDDKPLARQRRRRTSPEDQAILEAAYNRDPKPDKAGRLEIVKRVSLGEKEVQIWFQNRRQTSRRKSRPLLPHEIAQYQFARGDASPHPSSDCRSSSPHPQEDLPTSTDVEAQLQDELNQKNRREVASSSSFEASPDVPRKAGVPASTSSSLDLPTQPENSNPPPTLRETVVTAAGQSFVQPLHESAHDRVDHINPPGAPALLRSQSFDRQPSYPPKEPSTDSSHHPKKKSSFIRLCMTGEGNAEVVAKDSSSPSPPHASQAPPPSTSGNANSHLSLAAARIPPMRPLQRSFSGRARDSRVWEFWCDKEARAELEDTAEKDASGSAAGAIGLLRSASGRSVLGSIPSKRNSTVSRPSNNAKRSKLASGTPKLHKSSTALGRLEGKPWEKALHPARIPGNDSDKENWSPSTNMSPGDQSEPSPYYDSSLRSTQTSSSNSLKRPRASFSNAERNRLESDPEVEAFMHGGRKSNSISGDEELDCVQGLLSLSQGNWR